MGCSQSEEVNCPQDEEELMVLRSSVRREDLQLLPDRQLRKRLKELGSKLDLEKSELLEWVLFRNALLIIFGNDDSKVGAALKAIQGLQLDNESVVAALVALRPGDRRNTQEKDMYRMWAKQLNPDQARALLRKTLFRRSALRSVRGFLSFSCNLMLQAIMREWRNMCACRMALKSAAAGEELGGVDTQFMADDTDVGDEGDKMLAEGRDNILAHHVNGVGDSRKDDSLDTADIVFADEDAVPDLPPSPQKRDASRASFADLDLTLNKMFDDERFDDLSARLTKKERDIVTPRGPHSARLPMPETLDSLPPHTEVCEDIGDLPPHTKVCEDIRDVAGKKEEVKNEFLPGIYLGPVDQDEDADTPTLPQQRDASRASLPQQRDASRASVDVDVTLDNMFKSEKFDSFANERLFKNDTDIVNPQGVQPPASHKAPLEVPALQLTPQKRVSSRASRVSSRASAFDSLDDTFDKMFEDRMFDNLSARLSKKDKQVVTPREARVPPLR
eukprot:gnl/MRDRNA2_/MRDRNA2_27039_c0_seq1.p1 gnl/MRDRNA2_/MRDRNA2_27039_c0~~gnl/MRDRNA2_/MRDRNA2_27039_c0_seq1.p1  ORF type:complete len:503 (-),score=102.22 gnl/MRDRNA2_/MRDRNA2_27039_c0_seq1:99-1607(-)